MSISTHVLPPVRSSFSRLIDYAGLFPPAKLGMAEAIREYVRSRDGDHAWMFGRFIVPASALDEFDGSLGAEGGIERSVIVDAKSDAREWFTSAQALFTRLASRAHVDCLEVPLPSLRSRRETYDATIGQVAMLAERFGLRNRPIYVEIPRDERWEDLLEGAMAAFARYGLGAKIRCGGVIAEAFPRIEQVAAFIKASALAGVPFKATAGLHHPVRHRDGATGFSMHGFLNILTAAVFAHRVDSGTLHAIIEDEASADFVFDEGSLGWRDLQASDEEIAAAREHGFVAYGSCSFREPVEDLTALSILPPS